MASTLPGIGAVPLGEIDTLPGIADGETAAQPRLQPLPAAGAHTALAQLCARMGVTVQIAPGLAADAPPLSGGDDPRYHLGVELGRGGGGRVHLATDRDLRRSLALKVLQEPHLADPMRVQAFLEEAVITAGLEHPNIVPIYDIGWSPSFGVFYTMQRLSGATLADLLTRARQRPEAARAFGLYRALGVFTELCRGVAHAHRRGVIHSDLKPENVFVGDYGEVVIVDWGMAQLLGPDGASQVRARIRGGTPEYMAPEQCVETGSHLGVGVDVWALGVILYELLAGDVPFQGATPQETAMRVLIEPLVPPADRAPARGIPPGLDQICVRALERDRTRRYPSVDELLGDIQAHLAGTRERARRAEQIVHAIESASLLLGAIATPEQEIDAELARPEPELELERLEALRAQLLDTYVPAARALLRGLELDPTAPLLHRHAGDLYWRLFTRVYPSRVRPSALIAARALDLLTGLSQRASASIVRAGAERSGGDADASTWLSVVQQIAEQDPRGGTAMKQVTARVTSLGEIPLFREMHPANLLPIAEACTERRYAPGAAIFAQGAPGDALFVLLGGHVDILRDGAVINTLHPGECFGEIAVLGETARTASAIAVDHVHVLSLDAPRFRQIVRERGEIGVAVIQALSERIRVATRREAALRSLAGAILSQHGDRGP